VQLLDDKKKLQDKSWTVTYEHLILKEFEQLNFSVDVDAIAIG
jgi:hypothetical protein